MKVVIASDSFKESLSSASIAEAAETGIKRLYPDTEISKFSVSDGGEGLTESIVSALGGQYVNMTVSDPLGRSINAVYGICSGTAVIEMAAASGLPLVAPQERNPMHTTTFGTGELIADAINKGCRKILLGMGGSATCDGGTGMLEALGWRFLDKNGNALHGIGGNLVAIATIDDSGVPDAVKETEFTVACDVRNPFSGPQGASYIFSPQKGANPQEVEQLDCGLTNFAAIIAGKYGTDITSMEGAGAAGGLGGACKAFLNATLKRGIEMVLDAINIDDAISDADLVITGEGKVDSQTPSGKTAAGVLGRCQKHGVPCVAIGGMVAMCDELLHAGFAGIFPILSRPCTLQEAMDESTAFENVARTALQIVSLYNSARQ